jgi:hypothetical protein
MVALPLKLTRPGKSRNQPLAFKPDVTLTIAFDPCLPSRSGGVIRARVSGKQAARPRSRVSISPLCFNSISCAEENGFVAETLLGRTIAKD